MTLGYFLLMTLANEVSRTGALKILLDRSEGSLSGLALKD